MSFVLDRRTVLRGLGRAAIALPALEVMLDRHGVAYAGNRPIPRRYVVCFGGTALGCDGDPHQDDYVPDIVGRDYDLKLALEPLADVKNEVSVVSGLRIPAANKGPVPAAGRPDDFHVSSASPLLSGVRSATGMATCGGPTSDQIVASRLCRGLPFTALTYRAQAAWYLSVASPYGREYLSYKTGAGGKVVPIPATTSPQEAFAALFGDAAPSGGPAEKAAWDRKMRRRRSVLDLVRGNTARLMPRLGTSDRDRLSRHFDELRDVERRIAALPSIPRTAACQPADPGADPPLGGNQRGTKTKEDFNINNGYSNEDERARTFCDLIHMAFACDLSRVASLMITMFQSHLSAYPIVGARCDIHDVGHNGDPKVKGTKAVSKVVAWHVRHFAYLVRKLRDTPEGAGRLIDNAALVLLHEGGHGLDTATGVKHSTHSTENMACLVAGRAGGLKPGKHVAAAGKHPANVLVGAMNAAGVPVRGLGEATGSIPELFT